MKHLKHSIIPDLIIGAVFISLIIFALFVFSLPAKAATFCHVETGQCLDPQPNDSADQYLKRYHPEITAGWVVTSAPDGTEHNATAVCANNTCSFTNPSPPPSPHLPKTMTKGEFQLYAYAVLGAVANPSGSATAQQQAGIVRFGQIILAMRGSNDPGTAAAFDGYNNNSAFDLLYVETFLSIIANVGIVTPTEVSAFTGNWPTK